MSILIKPYEIAVYEDKVINGEFKEQRLGIIGSDKMIFEGRAIEPELTRNVNGQNKFSFKMYKHFVDTMTGEKVENPFIPWLISERKVKLKYEDKWFDFIIKDINENSSNYLYTYQLEDAVAQELSKNGFGVTLDAALMNNIGNSEELGKAVMAETDWEVSADKIVETIEEALVYVEIPANTQIVPIIDQQKDVNGDYSDGVTIGESRTLTTKVNVLAFYSSCKNKPHRFQFIYLDTAENQFNNYAKDKVSVDSNRVICEKDCQYYIEFDNPEEQYLAHSDILNLDLPTDFGVVVAPANGDTSLSTYYRGKKYAFAPQSIYVPMLDKYCQRFTKTASTFDTALTMHYEGSENDSGISLSEGVYTKNKKYSGLKLLNGSVGYTIGNSYKLKYVLEIAQNENGSTLKRIGGHKPSYKTDYYVYEVNGDGTRGSEIGHTNADYYEFATDRTQGKIWVEAYYLKEKNEDHPYPFIQPNRGLTLPISFKISDLEITDAIEYLSYTDTEYVSPTLIQNYINNYNFDSAAGWTMAYTERNTLQDEPQSTNCYGRFVNNGSGSNEFVQMLDDFLQGSYSEDNTYHPYMKFKFTVPEQFVLNSGLRDNRTIIKNLNVNEELVFDYQIFNSAGEDKTSSFTISIGEYLYSSSTGGYAEKTGKIAITEIAITESDPQWSPGRKIFKVTSANYTEEAFKEESKLYLRINGPTTLNTDGNGKYIAQEFYLKKAKLYRKVLNDSGEIIAPEEADSTGENNSITSYTQAQFDGILKKTYNYFPRWVVESGLVTSAEALHLNSTNTLNYTSYIPIYNTGAEKIRTVSVKESNYFNNLQSIAENFEQWLTFDIDRADDGSITHKRLRFKNYSGNDNYACFRYGVNLKDIQRTYASKNIVTKLYVKTNSNEYAEDGFCTIQRAGANPTGESYIYDFQYYQNQGLMPVQEYLDEVYYMDTNNSKGPDSVLWSGNMLEGTLDEMTLKGYYPRLKKLNDSLLPINNQLSGEKIDLIQYQSQQKIAQSTFDAALSGIASKQEDFKALTGVYPEEISSDKLVGVEVVSATTDSQFKVIKAERNTNNSNAIDIEVEAVAKNKAVSPSVNLSQGLERYENAVAPYIYQIRKDSKWDGLSLTYDYQKDTNYILEYDITLNSSNKIGENNKELPSILKNIGCHNDGAFVPTEINESNENKTLPFITVTRTTRYGKTITSSDEGQTNLTLVTLDRLLHTDELDSTKTETEFPRGTEFHVVVQGKYTSSSGATSPYFWIQPNRGIDDAVTCTITNIKMYIRDGLSGAAGTSRKAYVSLIVTPVLEYDANGTTPIQVAPNRKYTVEVPVATGETTGTATQVITTIDETRSDVRQYLQEYTTCFEKKESSSAELNDLMGRISGKEQTISLLEATQKNYLLWKQKLNQLFFKKYSRFIQEGTWIDEQYVDDEKYYADAQSVLYNSCYPQVAYNINVLELSSLPGYELFNFELGDKTWAIDDEFFGEGHREEVIIAEKSDRLDDPTQNRIKVQNFKNQFQDLFQRITATVQQAQYSAGAYEQGAALVNANEARKNKFITDAINNAATFLAPGKSHTVTWDGGDGITVTDDTTPTNQVRIVGGAILLSAEDPTTKEQTWITGVTNQGISASLITAGKLNTGQIQIMSGDEPVFRWDAYGISAYDAVWYNDGAIKTISGVNSKKFVRFDKNGIYGVNNIVGIDGATWHPTDKTGETAAQEIDKNATFALTWEGLKVTGNDGVVARIGKLNNNILNITKDEESLMSFSNDGTLTVGGWSVSQDGLENYVQPTASTFRMRRVLSEPEKNVYLRSTPKEETFLVDDEEYTKNILLRVGDNFRVTNDGEFFASAGKIGSVSIGSIASTDYADSTASTAASTAVNNLEVGGRNLFVSANAEWFASIATKSLSNNGWNVSAPNGSGGLRILENIMTPGQQYILSYKFKKTDGTLASIGGHSDSYNTNKFELDGITKEGNPHSGFSMEDDALIHTVKWYFTRTDNNVNDKNLYIQVNRKSGGGAVTFDLWDVKLEKGNKATDWTPAPEDVQAEINATNEFITSVQTDLQDQIDGAITSWFENGAPKPQKINGVIETEKNYPANDWDEGAEAINHEGDLYYDKSSGFCYRWVCDKNGDAHGTHYWILIQDESISQALAAAQNAQNTADGKMSFYSTPPETGMSEGDLLIPNTTDVGNNYKAGKIYRYTNGAWVEVIYSEEIDTKIGQIRVGAVNLLRGTHKDANWTSARGINFTKNSGEYSLTSNTIQESFIYYQMAKVEKQKTYTIAFDAKKVGPLSSGEIFVLQDGWSAATGGFIKNKNFSPTDTYSRYFMTFTVPNEIGGNLDKCEIRFDHNGSTTEGENSTIYIKDLIMVEGNVVASWSESPEELNDIVNSIQAQVDGKAEIFYQSTDPQPSDGSWNNDESIGNMWRNTTDNKEYVWNKDGETYGWHEIEIPDNIFDAYDGKATLYTSKPTNYHVNDLWILDEATQISSDCPTYTSANNTEAKYKAGTLLVATTSVSANSYSKSDWVEKTRYTDDTRAEAINTQLKGDIQAVSRSIETMSGEISSGTGIFEQGLKQKVTKDALNSFEIQAGSIIIYDETQSNNDGTFKRIFSAEPTTDGKGAVYLAGWTVTYNQLTNGTIGASNSFGIYPSGITVGLNSSFNHSLNNNDAWILTAGTSFGLTKQGQVYASAGKIGPWTLSSGGLEAYVDKYKSTGITLDYDNSTIYCYGYSGTAQRSIQIGSSGVYTYGNEGEFGKYAYLNNTGLHLVEDSKTESLTYVTLSGMKTRLTSAEDRLNSLGFKGPYTIRCGTSSSGEEVGRVYQLGTIVYGALFNTAKLPIYNNDDVEFTFWDGSTRKYLPSPHAASQLNCPYTRKDNSSKRTMEVELKADEGNLKMTCINSTGTNSPYDHWTYFCYSTSSDHHPD